MDRSLSYQCSSLCSISTTSIAILHWTNVNTTHLAQLASAHCKKEDRCASKERDITCMRCGSASRPAACMQHADGDRMQSWCPGVCHCFQVSLCPIPSLWTAQQAARASLSAVVVVGKPAIAKSARRRSIIHACLCRVVPSLCVLYFILRTTGVNLRIGAPVNKHTRYHSDSDAIARYILQVLKEVVLYHDMIPRT